MNPTVVRVVCGVAVLLWGVRPCLPETAEEQQARRGKILELMAEEGLGPQNCRLQGTNIEGVGATIMPWPFPEEGFPYKWDFDDGTLCGINETGSGISDMRVEQGLLKFKTQGSAQAIYFSWGDFDERERPLRFGYDQRSPGRLAYMELRLRQSLAESRWQLAAKDRRGTRSSDFVIVKGTEWQIVTIPISSGFSPYSGIRLLSDTPGNTVEIDWVRPCIMGGRPCYRKTIELPALARWVKVSISSAPRFTLYVNGKQAVRSPQQVGYKHMWNHDLDPGLFRKGRNVLALESGVGSDIGLSRGQFTLDGAILCEDGSYLRVDSDTSWKFKQALDGVAWTGEGYDDSDWGDTEECWQPKDYPPRNAMNWFNPSYKGRIMVAPADGRTQPVFGGKEDVALRVAVAKHMGETHEISYQVLDEMGDGFRAEDKLVAEGDLKLETGNWKLESGNPASSLKSPAFAKATAGRQVSSSDDLGVLTFPSGSLPHNRAYALVLHLLINGEEVEKRRYEIAVCGPVNQPVVENPKDYTDGMELNLVWETDAAAEQKEGEFISCDGKGTPRESKVIETPLGRFRQTWNVKNVGTPSACNYLSFKYSIAHPGRPHVAIAEYPDDTDRVQEMRLVDRSPLDDPADKKANMLANHTAICGIENPLTHEIRQHHAVFFPNRKQGTVTLLCVSSPSDPWQPSMAARVGRIRIHEIMNDIPVRRITDAPGRPKWIGQQPERGPIEVMTSCFASPISGLIRKYLICSDTPNFYRNWMVTDVNLVKRLRFAGENAYHFGQYMYNGVLYPSVYADATSQFHAGYSGDLRDYGVLMAKMFEENGLGWFSSLEFWGMDRLQLTGPDEDMADGMETLAQVSKDGRQLTSFRGRIILNYVHPKARKHFETVINELIALYGKEPGWKGITVQLNEVLGPCWHYGSRDPYYASYDDTTIALFEKETGIRIPEGRGQRSEVSAPDPERFTKRYAWLMTNAKQEWTDWRCAKLAEVYDWIKNRLKETREDLRLNLYCSVSNYLRPPLDTPAAESQGVYDYARQGGIDIERFLKDPDITVYVNAGGGSFTKVGAKTNESRHHTHHERTYAGFCEDGQNAVAVRYGWAEPDAEAPEGWPWQLSDAESWQYPSGEYFADRWINVFVRSNPAELMHPIQDISMWTSRETDMSRFAKAFRSIPAGKYTRLTGDGRDRNVWIAVCPYEGSVYVYIANTMWWEVQARVEFAPEVQGHDLIDDTPLASQTLKLTLAPYTMHTFRLTGAPPEDAIVSCTTEVSEKGQRLTRELLNRAEGRVPANRALLTIAGRIERAESILAGAKRDLTAGDWASTYETLNGYAYQSLWVRKIVRKRPGPYEPRTMTAKQRTGNVTIDGDLADWKDVPATRIDDKGQIFPASEALEVMWTGPSDASALVQAQWDEENIYLAFTVTDDSLSCHPHRMHRGDSVEAYFDTELLKDKGHNRYSDDDSHLKLAPPAKGQGPLRMVLKQSANRPGETERTPAEIEHAWSRTDNGYRIEVKLPWKFIRREPVRAGLEIGFDTMLNDADGEALFKQWMIWSSNQTICFKDPTSFGRLVLGE